MRETIGDGTSDGVGVDAGTLALETLATLCIARR
jgi:hypothetical protein